MQAFNYYVNVFVFIASTCIAILGLLFVKSHQSFDRYTGMLSLKIQPSSTYIISCSAARACHVKGLFLFLHVTGPLSRHVSQTEIPFALSPFTVSFLHQLLKFAEHERSIVFLGAVASAFGAVVFMVIPTCETENLFHLRCFRTQNLFHLLCFRSSPSSLVT